MPLEAHFTARDGAQLFTRFWPVESPRARLILVHGFGEHSGRYAHVAQRFNALGLSVLSYDQRGHGRSPGKRGEVRRFATLVEDLRDFVEQLPGTQEPPEFLLGHSMGGLVLAHYVLAHNPPVRGLVFSGALLRLNDTVPKLVVKLAPLLSVVTPWLPVSRIRPEDLSRDASVVDSYRADPFVYHGRIGVRTGAQLQAAVRHARAGLAGISQPLYLLCGGADQIVPPAGSEDLYARASSPDKTLKRYTNGYHEPLHDIEQEVVLEELCEWLERHC